MKKSYYLEGGLYFDTTTQTIYEPKPYCEICGRRTLLTVHHFLKQQKCLRDLASKRVITPSTWTKEFINKFQKLYLRVRLFGLVYCFFRDSNLLLNLQAD
mgnify:CR=1 FL=1